jgi:hypothetical protein
VLVEHQREGATALAHLVESLEHTHRLGEQHRRATDLARDLIGVRQADAESALGGAGTKKVVDEENPVDVVEFVNDHGKARVAGVTNGFGDGFGGDRQGQVDDVDARRHHVAQLQFGEFVDATENFGGVGRRRHFLSVLGAQGNANYDGSSPVEAGGASSTQEPTRTVAGV